MSVEFYFISIVKTCLKNRIDASDVVHLLHLCVYGGGGVNVILPVVILFVHVRILLTASAT